MSISGVLWYISAGGLAVVPLFSVVARRKLRGSNGDHPKLTLWISVTLSTLGVLMLLYKTYGVQVTANP